MKINNTYYSNNSEDRLLEKLLSFYGEFFNYLDFISTEDTVSKKIKSMTVNQFLQLQMIVLSEKVHITESGRKKVYIDLMDIFDYYSLLDYEKENGRYHRIANNYKKIQDLCVKFLELESILFDEIKNPQTLIDSFFERNFSSIIDHYLNNDIENLIRFEEDFFSKAKAHLSKICENWTSIQIQEVLRLKKTMYDLNEFSLYLK